MACASPARADSDMIASLLQSFELTVFHHAHQLTSRDEIYRFALHEVNHALCESHGTCENCTVCFVVHEGAVEISDSADADGPAMALALHEHGCPILSQDEVNPSSPVAFVVSTL